MVIGLRTFPCLWLDVPIATQMASLPNLSVIPMTISSGQIWVR